MVDRVIPKSKNNRLLPTIAVLLLALIGAAYALFGVDYASQRVERDHLLISQVERGDLTVSINASGVLLPRDVEWIAAEVEGRIGKIPVQAGDEVRTGQLLVELVNPELLSLADEALSQYEEVLATLSSFKTGLEKELLNQKSEVLRARFEYESAQLQLQAESELINQSNPSVAAIDYERTKLSVVQLGEIYAIEKEKLAKDEDNVAAQIRAKEAQVAQLKKALDRANEKVAALNVRAGIDGVVQSLSLKVGQHLNLGDEVTRLARLDHLYAELQIPAAQANQLQIDQAVEIDMRTHSAEGRVTRIDPSAALGVVVIDVELASELEDGRADQGIEGTVFIEQLQNTLHVGRPVNLNSGGPAAVYRISSDGRYADLADVQFGQVGLSRIQVLSGLDEGDQIILTDASRWDGQRILLN